MLKWYQLLRLIYISECFLCNSTWWASKRNHVKHKFPMNSFRRVQKNNYLSVKCYTEDKKTRGSATSSTWCAPAGTTPKPLSRAPRARTWVKLRFPSQTWKRNGKTAKTKTSSAFHFELKTSIQKQKFTKHQEKFDKLSAFDIRFKLYLEVWKWTRFLPYGFSEPHRHHRLSWLHHLAATYILLTVT